MAETPDSTPSATQLPVGAPDHLPFLGSPEAAARLRVSVRPLEASAWLEVDALRAEELALKEQLLEGRRDEVLAWLPDTEAASREVLDAVVESLRSDHGIDTAPDPDRHPIDAAGRLVQEDLCLHLERGGELVLAAASVCFPQEWRLRDKIGRSVREVHRPVPGYEREIAAAVDRLLSRLVPERPMWRVNWSVNSDPARFQTGFNRGRPGVVTADGAGRALWLRVERQTLRRFPVHGAVLFTIRTYQRRLDELAARRDGSAVCSDLAAAVRALPEPMRRYKGLDVYGDALLAWLDDHS